LIQFPIFRALAIAIATLFLATAAAADQPAAGFVRVEGRNFVTPDGKPILLKGISLGNWLVPEGYMWKFKVALSPKQIGRAVERVLGPQEAEAFWRRFREEYVTEADIRFIKAAGFNTIRVPLHFAEFTTQPAPGEAPRFEGDGYRLLDRVIAWAKAAGLYVIVDLHAAPGGQTGINQDDSPGYPLTFYVPAHRRLTVALWRHLAQRYRDETTILGWDLLNEPISPYHDMDFLNPRLEPFYREIIQAIREVDQNHIAIMAGGQWSTNFTVFGAPFAPNLAYTYHKFWAALTRDQVQPYVDFSHRWNVPIFLGETGELTDDWNRGYRLLNEAHNISWSFWTYKNLDSGSTVVSIPRPDGWDDVIAMADTPERARPIPRDKAIAIFQQYLAGLSLEKADIRWGYLASLGLADSPAALKQP
jgi:GNAT superfamily N-acetyltransferase